MDPLVTSSLISAGSSLLGGAIGGGSKTPRYYPYYKAMLGPEVAKSNTGAVMNGMIDKIAFKARMEAAKDNGIHPLAMLGVNFPSSSPVAVGGGESSATRFGDALASAGQDIGRAFHAYKTAPEREMAKKSAALDLDIKEAQRDLLRSQIFQINSAGSPPAFPSSNGNFISGQGDTAVKSLPLERIASPLGDIGREVGNVPSYTIVKTRSGNMVIPSKDFQDRAEDIPYVGQEWYLRNRLLPAVSEIDQSSTRSGASFLYKLREMTGYNRRTRYK